MQAQHVLGVRPPADLEQRSLLSLGEVREQRRTELRLFLLQLCKGCQSRFFMSARLNLTHTLERISEGEVRVDLVERRLQQHAVLAELILGVLKICCLELLGLVAMRVSKLLKLTQP